jgi:uncharacterized membrane protein
VRFSSPNAEQTAGLVLGFGIGGLADGVIAHQILGWHHMLSGWVPADTMHGMRTNTVGDGFFHLGCAVAIVVGVYLLNRSRPAGSGLGLTGRLLAGWGLFNLVEGTVDHHLLGIHHVHPGPNQALYDVGFLAIGAILLAVGGWLARTDPGRTSRAAAQKEP